MQENIFIDTNIFLETLLGQEKKEKTSYFLRKIASGKRAFISSFNVDSIVIALEKNGANWQDMKIFLESLKYYEGLIIYNATITDRVNAIDLMEKYQLDYEDSLTLQATISTGSKEIMSFDKHFDGIDEIKRIEP